MTAMQIDMTNNQQRLAYELISCTSSSFFLTGRAGTGKTTFLRNVQDSVDKQFIVLATTGVAAILAGGDTVHSFFGLPLGVCTPNVLGNMNYQKQMALIGADTVIIDEISMLRCDVVDAVDRTMRRVLRSSLPFGGKHILLFGDLAQVPAVVRARDDFTESAGQFFEATPYATFTRFSLPTVMRQNPDETAFLALLSDIRDATNALTPESIRLLHTRFLPGVIDDVVDEIDTFVGPDSPDGMVITFTNAKAQYYNSLILSRRLPADAPHPFRLDATFCVRDPPSFLARPFQDPNIVRHHLATRLASESEIRIFFGAFRKRLINTIIPAHLQLCRGARVMLLQNINPSLGHINGARGTVVDYLEQPDLVAVHFDTDPPDRSPTLVTRRPAVEFPLARGQHIFMLQFPLKLCWAVTAHKAQGQTLSRIAIDISDDAFAHGALYVALSRVRSLSSVRLFGLPEFPEMGPSFHINPYIRWQDRQPTLNFVAQPAEHPPESDMS